MEPIIDGKCDVCEIRGLVATVGPNKRVVCKKCMAANIETLLYRLPIEVVAEIFDIAHNAMPSNRSK